ncbi:MAG: ABC transporter substrate-binding protein [archaeon]|nr:ABC transporter substrate-binding protein [archaeon]
MQKNQIIAIAAVLVIIIAGIAAVFAFTGDNEDKPVVEELKDFAGYDIKPVTDNFSKGIVSVGQDSFRWVTYFGLADKCVMVDMNDKTNYMAKAFMYTGKNAALNNSLSKTLSFTSTNCGVTDDDVAKIIDLAPSIVVVPAGFEQDYQKQMNALRSANLNIVHIGYIYTFLQKDTFEITSDLEKQIDILAKAFNAEPRAKELKSLFSDTVKDIRAIASKVTAKKTGYISCLAYNGAHGAESSIAYYIPFELAGIENILASEHMEWTGSGVDTFTATKISEKMKDDTVMFLDATGIFQCTDNTSIGILKLFAGHDAFIAYPYIWTGINYEDVLIAAYQLEHDVYGLLSDSELEKKVNAVFDGFLGGHMSTRSETAANTPAPTTSTSVYDDMSNMYETRRGNPTHGSVTITADGTIVYE